MSDEKRPVPTKPGESANPISFGSGHKTIRDIANQGVGGLRMTIAAANHPDVIAKRTEEQAQLELAAMQNRTPVIPTMTGKSAEPVPKRGESCWFDEKSGKKVTIIQACVAKTTKGRDIHKVVDRDGNVFRAFGLMRLP